MQMCIDHEPSGSFEGDLTLIRASEPGMNRNTIVEVADDYELKLLVNGTVEKVIIDGGHKSFLAKNGSEMGEIIESFFTSIACA